MLLVFLPEACGVWEEVCSKGEMVPEHMVLRTLLFLKQGEASET